MACDFTRPYEPCYDAVSNRMGRTTGLVPVAAIRIGKWQRVARRSRGQAVKLVSTKRETKKETLGKPEPYTPDPYSYNTRLCLDKDMLKALGLSPRDFKAGDKVTVEARGHIKSTKMVEGKDYDSNEVEIQITKIGVEKAAGSLKDAVSNGIKGAKDE